MSFPSDGRWYSIDVPSGTLNVMYEIFVRGEPFSDRMGESPIQLSTTFDRQGVPEVAIIETEESGRFVAYLFADNDFFCAYPSMLLYTAKDFGSFVNARPQQAPFRPYGDIFQARIEFGSRPMEVMLGTFGHGRGLHGDLQGQSYVRIVTDLEER